MSVEAYLEGMELMGWPEALSRYERLWVSYLDAQDAYWLAPEGSPEREEAGGRMSDAQEAAEAVVSFSLQQMTPPDKTGELMLAAILERHFADEGDPSDRPPIIGHRP